MIIVEIHCQIRFPTEKMIRERLVKFSSGEMGDRLLTKLLNKAAPILVNSMNSGIFTALHHVDAVETLKSQIALALSDDLSNIFNYDELVKPVVSDAKLTKKVANAIRCPAISESVETDNTD